MTALLKWFSKSCLNKTIKFLGIQTLVHISYKKSLSLYTQFLCVFRLSSRLYNVRCRIIYENLWMQISTVTRPFQTAKDISSYYHVLWKCKCQIHCDKHMLIRLNCHQVFYIKGSHTHTQIYIYSLKKYFFFGKNILTLNEVLIIWICPKSK